MPTNLTADHIAAGGGQCAYEPQRQNDFLVRIPRLGQVVELAVQSFTGPKWNMNPIEIHYLNESRWVAGKPSFDQLTLQCLDTVDRQVLATLHAWTKAVYNPTNGHIGLACNYKEEGDLIVFGPDGSSERTWRLIGCWPSAFDAGDFDMASGDRVVLTVQLQVDKILFQG